MRKGLKLGRIFGIDIFVDPSWFIIGALIAWSFSQLFATFLPSLSNGSHLLIGGIGTILFFASVVGHELSHSLVARQKKIPVASITLFIFGGVAKITSEPKTPKDEFQIAIAGPLSSVVFGFIFLGIGIASERTGNHPAGALFQVIGYVNFVLAVFNMLPGFPLDGGRVLRSIVWKISGSIVKATKIASASGRGVAAILVAYGLYQIVFQGEFVGGVWMIFIAMFLNQAAGASYQQVVMQQQLEGLRVEDLMTENPTTIRGNLTLDQAINDFFLTHRHSAFPVVGFGDQVEGLVTLQMVKEVPRELWNTSFVRQMMVPLSPEITASRKDPLVQIMERLPGNVTGRFLVLDGSELVGILTPTDVTRRLRLQSLTGEQL